MNTSLQRLALIALAAALAACSNNPEPEAAATAAAPVTEATPVADTATAEPRLYFIAPEDGAAVTSPVTVVFGLDGFSVAPAGTYEERTGHHHLLINTDLPDLGQPIPADAQHLHFGQGQTETVIELEPGEHTLQLVLGDGNHVPHDPPLVSERITIIVSAAD